MGHTGRDGHKPDPIENLHLMLCCRTLYSSVAVTPAVDEQTSDSSAHENETGQRLLRITVHGERRFPYEVGV